MWVNTEDLPTSDGHPFFERLNRVLEESGFDAFVEGLCEAFYACRLGRPSLRPGRYFRLLFIGYFEGVSSERGIAWRVADSLSLRSFLDLDMTEAALREKTDVDIRAALRCGQALAAWNCKFEGPRGGMYQTDVFGFRRAIETILVGNSDSELLAESKTNGGQNATLGSLCPNCDATSHSRARQSLARIIRGGLDSGTRGAWRVA